MPSSRIITVFFNLQSPIPPAVRHLKDFPTCSFRARKTDPVDAPTEYTLTCLLTDTASTSHVFRGFPTKDRDCDLVFKFGSLNQIADEWTVYDTLADSTSLPPRIVPELFKSNILVCSGFKNLQDERDTSPAFLVMHYAGEPLDVALSDLPRQDQADILTKLQHIHDTSGVIHLAVQPSHILRARDGGYRIIDFSHIRLERDDECRSEPYPFDKLRPFHPRGTGNVAEYGKRYCSSILEIADEVFDFWPETVLLEISMGHSHRYTMQRGSLLPPPEILDNFDPHYFERYKGIHSESEIFALSIRFFRAVAERPDCTHDELQDLAVHTDELDKLADSVYDAWIAAQKPIEPEDEGLEELVATLKAGDEPHASSTAMHNRRLLENLERMYKARDPRVQYLE